MSLFKVDRARAWGAILVTLVIATVSMWPVAANRSVILYPDSAGYFRAGAAALGIVRHAVNQPRVGSATAVSAPPATPAASIDTQGDGVSTQRSPYYGLLLVPLYELGGLTLLAFVQSLVLALTILLALRQLGVDGIARSLAVSLAVVLPGGAALFGSTAMPDIYLGAMILAIAILLTYEDRMRWGERLWFYLLVFAAMLFHRGNMVLAVCMILASGLGLLLARRRLFSSYAVLFGLTILAFGGHAAVDHMVLRTTGRPPINTPFLLARLIGDGTAKPFLDANCATEHYATCAFRARMPMSENDFLWLNDPERGAYGAATEAVRSQISLEESKIVLGVLRDAPVRQIQISVGNAVRQFLDVGVTEYGNYGLLTTPAALRATPLRYEQSSIVAGTMPLFALSAVMVATYLISLGALIVFAARALLARSHAGRRTDEGAARFWQASFIIVLGLLGNAAVCGILSGVFDRYQGRAAWLAPLMAVAWILRTKDPVRS